jgi:hypothetical protein
MDYVSGGDTQELEQDTKPKKAPAKGGKTSLIESAKKAKRWQTELDASKKWMDKFTKAARECEKQYLDIGHAQMDGALSNYAAKTNLFWSNVQVILSAIYGRLPKAEVDRKFKDFDDDVARTAGIIMERILNGDIEREHDDTNAAMRDAVQDRFVSGLGQVWCRYEVETEKVPMPVTDPVTGMPQIDPMGQPMTEEVEQILNEEAEVDYVYWDDFRYSPCRRWRECRWVARRVYMSKEKLKQRFSLTDQQLAMVPMQTQGPANNQGDRDTDVLKATPFKQAAVWEIWSKDDNYVCWFVEGCTFLLDDQPDPLELEDFFPCPQPVVATTLTSAFLPRPDYAMTQDLYKELDRINAKISHLTDAVKCAGVYDKTAGPLKQLLTTGVENSLVPADNWSAFTEKGGLKGVVDWMPIEQYVNAIVQLNQRKAQLQHDLYEVLGISDIMRGASVASETATAQQLKVQYGGARLSNLQNEVARFVSAVMRIRANIISNLFQPETILKRSQIERTPDAALAQPAIQMLKDFGTSMYSIEVTSDSLAAPDWAAEKEARTEFLGAASNYIMAAAPIVQQSPETGAFLIKLLQWAAAGFKGAKTIEGVLDEAARALTQKAQQPPPPPPPTPEDDKNKAQAAKYGAEAEKTAKETALMPNPLPPPGMPPGGPGGPIQMTAGGPQPGGPQPMGAGPGSVAPFQPQQPAPLNGAPM